MKNTIITIFCLVMLGACTRNTSEVFVTDQGAINGYDPVAYFTSQRPVPGSPDFSYEWNGAVWRFSSQENLDLFKSNPAQYAPQFGGYCAFGMAGGHKAKTEPDAWTIVDGRLYLNYNKEVQGMWLEKRDELIEKAEANWPSVREKAFE